MRVHVSQRESLQPVEAKIGSWEMPHFVLEGWTRSSSCILATASGIWFGVRLGPGTHTRHNAELREDS